MDGVELFRRMKHIQNDLQAVLITAFCTSDVQVAASSAGVQSILRKPIDAGQLLRMTQEIVNQK